MNKAPRVLYFDIETSPCTGWFWGTGNQYVGAHQILESGKIICIAYRFSDWRKGRVKSLEWDKNQNDRQMLKDFSKVAREADIVIGHNGDKFDIRWVNARIAYHSLPELDLTSSEDTYKMVRKKLYLPSYKLDYLCKYFGLDLKLTTVSGLWEEVTFKNNRKALKNMVKYCKNDVLVLAQLDDRISDYVDRKINRTVYTEEFGCPRCGNNEMCKDGFRYTRVGKYQSYICKACNKKSRSGHNLLQSGKYLR